MFVKKKIEFLESKTYSTFPRGIESIVPELLFGARLQSKTYSTFPRGIESQQSGTEGFDGRCVVRPIRHSHGELKERQCHSLCKLAEICKTYSTFPRGIESEPIKNYEYDTVNNEVRLIRHSHGELKERKAFIKRQIKTLSKTYSTFPRGIESLIGSWIMKLAGYEVRPIRHSHGELKEICKNKINNSIRFSKTYSTFPRGIERQFRSSLKINLQK